eukprot:12896678-Prorocentrum_lima.AAC.1
MCGMRGMEGGVSFRVQSLAEAGGMGQCSASAARGREAGRGRTRRQAPTQKVEEVALFALL